jgi:8-oxo-dGTP pyrophosphatase MutT (NUDIX family)
MLARVKVRGVIWVGDRIIVNRYQGSGAQRATLPGGRVREREAITDGLRREVQEELGIDSEVGQLLAVAEVKSAVNHHDVELIFEVKPTEPIDPDAFELVDPVTPEVPVLPPVLGTIAACHGAEPPNIWLGNIYDTKLRFH